ncbi:MAG: hypothetical protein JW715_16165, partial [Sedimentisphaerales bacterium]|nr:hypothetical protein [Sedimentisphaerales bacterium]
FASWGLLFWYYQEIIYATAFDEDKLPRASLGGFFGFYEFIWKIVKSVYTIIIVLLAVGLPYLLMYLFFWATGFNWPAVLYILLFVGFFLLPMAILNVAVGRDLTLLRPDYLLIPILRAFMPYMVTVLYMSAAFFLQSQASQFAGQDPAAAAGHLALNLVAQILVFIAMRSIGLFARHYSCHLPW